ncbi:glycosyltransferase [Treponema sp. TIM-1]|uniref:glycosyltransferase n=1 Tax=Treponema sp. TIM-1 TaxID=2898417 RepID=UPI00397F2A4D
MLLQNDDKILTIGLPCYNEENSLDTNLNNLFTIILNNSLMNEVSVLVSNNCSTDRTESICKKYRSLYPDIFTYVTNETNIGPDRNFHNVVKCSKSQYVWLLSGNDSIVEGALSRVLGYIREYKPSYIYINFIPDTTCVNDCDVCFDKETFIKSLKWRCSLISSNIVKKDLWLSFNMEKYFDSAWIHMGYVLELLNHFIQKTIVSNKIDIIPNICSQRNTWDKNGNLLLFGLNLFKMIDEYLLDKASIAYELGQRSMSIGYPGTIVHAREQGLKITKDTRLMIKKAMSYNKPKYLFMCLPVIIFPEFLFRFVNSLFHIKRKIKSKIKKLYCRFFIG